MSWSYLNDGKIIFDVNLIEIKRSFKTIKERL